MKFQYTTQEKLWDLRRDHKYTLEYVADAVKISPATLSKYENKENKEYNNATLNKLAQFYGVSLDWLICNTLFYLIAFLTHLRCYKNWYKFTTCSLDLCASFRYTNIKGDDGLCILIKK